MDVQHIVYIIGLLIGLIFVSYSTFSGTEAKALIITLAVTLIGLYVTVCLAASGHI